MSEPKVTRFEGHGPKGTGLQVWDPIPADHLTAGNPVQRGHLYLHDDKTGLMAGVWDCTPFTSKPSPYSVNEFMHVLEGSVTIVEASGKRTTVRAGETFVIYKGTPCSWEQAEYIRKFFVIFPDKGGAAGKQGVVTIDTKAPLARLDIADPSVFTTGVPTQHNRTWFEGADGQMRVGVWDTTPFSRHPARMPHTELMHLLDGSVTIGDGAAAQTFKAGDTFLVPEGAPYRWTSTGYVRKIYCIVKPKAAAAGRAAAE
jgi:uncharacterized cupin superfamily protein